jgi:gliding motility-associated lipoprotein GldH
MRKFIILFLSALFLSGCEQKHFYSEFKDIDIKAWKSTDTLTYPIKIEQENKQFQYAISVRHSKDYEFSNLWLKIFIKGNGVDTSFRYEIPLFKTDGKPYGKSSGSLCTQTIPLKTILPLNKKGEYKISVVQLMRKVPLDGISDIGIIADPK